MVWRGHLVSSPRFLRWLVLPNPVAHCSLTTLRQKLLKIGARLSDMTAA